MTFLHFPTISSPQSFENLSNPENSHPPSQSKCFYKLILQLTFKS